MPTRTVSISDFSALIQPGKIPAEYPHPARVSLVFGTDHTGEEAFHISLIFPDATTDESLSWQKLKGLIQWVHQTIWSASGEEIWPYVYVRRESDTP